LTCEFSVPNSNQNNLMLFSFFNLSLEIDLRTRYFILSTKNEKMKIGLYFGTFNPIHVGHLIIANHMAENSDLDQVWLVVTPHNRSRKKARSMTTIACKWHTLLRIFQN
jgi:cytidyltransferase-like protein